MERAAGSKQFKDDKPNPYIQNVLSFIGFQFQSIRGDPRKVKGESVKANSFAIHVRRIFVFYGLREHH